METQSPNLDANLAEINERQSGKGCDFRGLKNGGQYGVKV